MLMIFAFQGCVLLLLVFVNTVFQADSEILGMINGVLIAMLGLSMALLYFGSKRIGREK